MENIGFYARDMMVWKRPSGIPKGLNVAKKLEKMGYKDAQKWEGWHSCLRNEWEAICVVQKPLLNNYITTLQKSGIGLFNAEYQEGFQSNIIEGIGRDTPDSYNTHCTVKPLKLMEKLAKIIMPPSEENILIDPFMGSGTTLLACKNLKIHYLGIDISSSYVDIARKRLGEAPNPTI